jgi:hypothetical protein
MERVKMSQRFQEIWIQKAKVFFMSKKAIKNIMHN